APSSSWRPTHRAAGTRPSASSTPSAPDSTTPVAKRQTFRRASGTASRGCPPGGPVMLVAMTCARCGRSRRADELTGLGTTLDRMPDGADIDGRVFLEGRTWARISSADICPDCLKPEEERELARSYIRLIEDEVARSQAAGGDPDPREPVLVAYALV